jgi:hypothetical protein
LQVAVAVLQAVAVQAVCFIQLHNHSHWQVAEKPL